MTDDLFSYDDIVDEFRRQGENPKNIDKITMIFKNFGLIRETQTKNGKKWFMRTGKKIDYKLLVNTLLQVDDNMIRSQRFGNSGKIKE